MKHLLKIEKLIVKGFRSFSSAVIDFDNPLFLVGRNGAGKTNFAEIFSFVADAMSSPLQAVFDRRGGIASVRTRKAPRSYPPNMGFCFVFGQLNGSVQRAQFSFEIRALPNHGFEVLREFCRVRLTDGRDFYYDRGKEFSGNTDLKPSVEPSALVLPVVGGDERFAPVLKTLLSMRRYSIEPATLRTMQDPDSGTSLRSDGSNAASVWQELSKSSKETREKILSFLEKIVPYTTAVKTKRHGNKVSLEFTQEWEEGKKIPFEGFNMSDGTLRAFGLLMAVFQVPPPSVLVIEEPEATIHPGALDAILDVIRRASQIMQVVVTTHSPEVLDARWIKDRHLRIVTWEKGSSYISALSESSRKAMQNHLMGAGELLRSNALSSADLFQDELSPRQTSLFDSHI